MSKQGTIKLFITFVFSLSLWLMMPFCAFSIDITNYQTELKSLHSETKPSFVSTFKQKVAGYVKKTVSSMRYTSYKLGGDRFDSSRGVYVLDCSSYVDHILQEINPNAYSNLVSRTGTDKPTTEHYYDFFRNLSRRENDYWSKINDANELKPGDILVFRKKNNRGGHVMVVMDESKSSSNTVTLRVADSAPSRHSDDTRAPHESGVGIGNLQLKIDPITGKPSAYSWKEGCKWSRNVNIAMARPNDDA